MTYKIDNTDEARQFLLAYMREHFIDKTFGEYILARLAGDFAWNLASAMNAERLRAAAEAPVVASDNIERRTLQIRLAFAKPARRSRDRLMWDVEHLLGHIALLKAAAPASPAAPVAPHPDDVAVDRFAVAMKGKMAASRAKGRGGWDDPDQCTASDLRGMLAEHLRKGDPVDVGNFAMMLWNRAESTAAAPVAPSADVKNPTDAESAEGGTVWGSSVAQTAAPVAQPADERAAFEAWITGVFMEAYGHAPSFEKADGSGDFYEDHRVSNAWEAWRARSKFATPAAPLAQQSEPVAKEGWVMMPARLTAENGAKGALSGEFKESITVTCHECGGSGEDEDGVDDANCPECNGNGTVEQDVPVTWDTIKEIYRAAVALYAGSAPASPVPSDDEILTMYEEASVAAMRKHGINALTSQKLIEFVRNYLAAPASTGPCSDDTAKDAARWRIMMTMTGNDTIFPLVEAEINRRPELDDASDEEEQKVMVEILTSVCDAALSAAKQGDK